jgi:hypothetical protein
MPRIASHFSTIKTVFVSLAAASLAVFVQPLAAGEIGQRQLSEEQRVRMETRMEEIRKRLALSDEQKAQFEPVIRRSFEQRAAVLEQHGVKKERDERLRVREARALKRDLVKIKKQTDDEAARILDSRQMDEYRKIQRETREALRDEVRKRQSRPAN